MQNIFKSWASPIFIYMFMSVCTDGNGSVGWDFGEKSCPGMEFLRKMWEFHPRLEQGWRKGRDEMIPKVPSHPNQPRIPGMMEIRWDLPNFPFPRQNLWKTTSKSQFWFETLISLGSHSASFNPHQGILLPKLISPIFKFNCIISLPNFCDPTAASETDTN